MINSVAGSAIQGSMVGNNLQKTGMINNSLVQGSLVGNNLNNIGMGNSVAASGINNNIASIRNTGMQNSLAASGLNNLVASNIRTTTLSPPVDNRVSSNLQKTSNLKSTALRNNKGLLNTKKLEASNINTSEFQGKNLNRTPLESKIASSNHPNLVASNLRTTTLKEDIQSSNLRNAALKSHRQISPSQINNLNNRYDPKKSKIPISEVNNGPISDSFRNQNDEILLSAIKSNKHSNIGNTKINNQASLVDKKSILKSNVPQEYNPNKLSKFPMPESSVLPSMVPQNSMETGVQNSIFAKGQVRSMINIDQSTINKINHQSNIANQRSIVHNPFSSNNQSYIKGSIPVQSSIYK